MPSSTNTFMNRNGMSTIVSLLLLTAVMAIWENLFNFSKTIQLPGWAELLPSPIDAPRYLVLFCLMPAAFIPTTLHLAVKGVGISVVFAPLLAVGIFASDPGQHGSFLVSNVLFNYGWIVLFDCAIPALLLLAVRISVSFLYARARG